MDKYYNYSARNPSSQVACFTEESIFKLEGKIFVDFNSEGVGAVKQSICSQHGFMCKGTEQEWRMCFK